MLPIRHSHWGFAKRLSKRLRHHKGCLLPVVSLLCALKSVSSNCMYSYVVQRLVNLQHCLRRTNPLLHEPTHAANPPGSRICHSRILNQRNQHQTFHPQTPSQTQEARHLHGRQSRHSRRLHHWCSPSARNFLPLPSKAKKSSTTQTLARPRRSNSTILHGSLHRRQAE